MTTYLITGQCGTGKTWIMKELIKLFDVTEPRSAGLYHWREQPKTRIAAPDNLVVLGRYEGSIFDGSDRLSMAVMTSNEVARAALQFKVVVAEGDRFTNSSFIRDFGPVILRVEGDGSAGRKLRGTDQSDRHLKAIATRVRNTPCDMAFADSKFCLNWLSEAIRSGRHPAPGPRGEVNLFS